MINAVPSVAPKFAERTILKTCSETLQAMASCIYNFVMKILQTLLPCLFSKKQESLKEQKAEVVVNPLVGKKISSLAPQNRVEGRPPIHPERVHVLQAQPTLKPNRQNPELDGQVDNLLLERLPPGRIDELAEENPNLNHDEVALLGILNVKPVGLERDVEPIQQPVEQVRVGAIHPHAQQEAPPLPAGQPNLALTREELEQFYQQVSDGRFQMREITKEEWEQFNQLYDPNPQIGLERLMDFKRNHFELFLQIFYAAAMRLQQNPVQLGNPGAPQ